MSGNYRGNTDPAIRALVHSQMLLEVLQDGYLPEGIHRDVTDFGDGTMLQIPTLGEMTLFDLDENQATPTSALDTGTITMTINKHKGVAGYVTDELAEDGYKAAAVEANIVPASLRSLREAYETDLLATAVNTTNGIIQLADPNRYNGVDHRWIANGTNNTITVEDFAYAKLAFDKANVPEEGRIFIVDPIVEMTLNNLTNIVNVSNNPQFEGMITKGFAKSHRFVRNIFGFDVWVSNRLPRITSEAITAGAGSPGDSTIANGVNNVALCIADDMCKPFMGAMRRAPRVEGHRNVSERRDEYHVTSRYGFAPQRGESLLSVITSESAYK
jgi:hypothetical protein